MRIGRLALLGVAAACSGGDGQTGSPYRTVVDTTGDTIVARTTGLVPEHEVRRLELVWQTGHGDDERTSFAAISSIAVGIDERVLVWDSRSPALKLYAPDGTLERIVGRVGGGPGEYQTRNFHGIEAHPSGHWLAFDGSNARVNLYEADGTTAGSWRVNARGLGGRAIEVDTLGRVWLNAFVPGHDTHAWIRLSASGAVLDTIIEPALDDGDFVTGRSGSGGEQRSRVPFGRAPFVTVSATGAFVFGHNTPFVLNTWHHARPLRIEKDWSPVGMGDEEREAARGERAASFLRSDPGWKWNGPDVPAAKPPVSQVVSARDGRIWVAMHVAGAAADRETVWEVFASDGVHLGRVRGPAVATRPIVFRGDQAWGIIRDSTEVPLLAKFRVVPPFAER